MYPRVSSFLAALIWLSAVVACQRRNELNEPRVAVVRFTTPVEREVTDYEYFTGRTDAVNTLNVQARVTGYLVAIDFVAGQEVKKNQRLFKIDPRPYQAVLDEAEGQVQLMEARYALAVADYKRAQEVAKTPGAISKQDLDKYAAAEAEAAAAVAAAKANSESAGLNLQFTDIISEIDGIVSRNLITLGNLVKQDQTLLTTVVSQDPMYVYFDVDEYTLLKVERLLKEGKIRPIGEGVVVPVQMGLADEGEDFPHAGKMNFVNNAVDQSTGTIEARGEFENPNLRPNAPRLLKPGMFVRVRLPIGPPYKALLVPQAAIGTDQGKKYLLVVNEKNVVEYRPIDVGPQQPDGLQVVIPRKIRADGSDPTSDDKDNAPMVDSLKLGDRVVVGGLQRVHAGQTAEARPITSAGLRAAGE